MRSWCCGAGADWMWLGGMLGECAPGAGMDTIAESLSHLLIVRFAYGLGCLRADVVEHKHAAHSHDIGNCHNLARSTVARTASKPHPDPLTTLHTETSRMCYLHVFACMLVRGCLTDCAAHVGCPILVQPLPRGLPRDEPVSPSTAAPTVSTVLAIVPDVFALAKERMEHTPSPTSRETFKFFCPLCMCYLKGA